MAVEETDTVNTLKHSIATTMGLSGCGMDFYLGKNNHSSVWLTKRDDVIMFIIGVLVPEHHEMHGSYCLDHYMALGQVPCGVLHILVELSSPPHPPKKHKDMHNRIIESTTTLVNACDVSVLRNGIIQLRTFVTEDWPIKYPHLCQSNPLTFELSDVAM